MPRNPVCDFRFHWHCLCNVANIYSTVYSGPGRTLIGHMRFPHHHRFLGMATFSVATESQKKKTPTEWSCISCKCPRNALLSDHALQKKNARLSRQKLIHIYIYTYTQCTIGTCITSSKMNMQLYSSSLEMFILFASMSPQ